LNKNHRRLFFFIGDMSHSSGTERVLSIIANGLLKRGYQVSLISLGGNGKTFFSLDKSIKVYWAAQERKNPGIIGNLQYLTALLSRERPDFLVDVDIILGCYSIFLKYRMPEIRWISWEHFNYYYHFERNHFLRKIVRRMVTRYSNHLIVLTEEDKKYYQKNLRLTCALTQIYNPVPYEDTFFKREELPFILAAGRLTEAKGFDLLIESWSLLEPKYTHWAVVVAGDGKDRSALEKKAAKAGIKNMRFVGAVSNIEEYYKNAAFFVLPSRNEGFAMVLLEAMFFSLPAVCYSCKTGPKEVICDGTNGFLVEPWDIKDFACKMEVLMNDKEMRREMGRQAADSVRKFEKENILDEWERIFAR
jgi:glycosyltransferase involved in cell wall biosynthesis